MRYQAQFTSFLPWLTVYLGIGCIIGLFEYGIAKHAFRNHPHRDAISQQDMFLTCLLKNAIAWPVILFWVGMLGVLKVYVFFRRRR
jgi:hypothetical protein